MEITAMAATQPSAFNLMSVTIACALFFCAKSLSADDHAEYDTLIQKTFWGDLYKGGGFTFYTKKPFSSKGPLITESHIYSTSWIQDHLQCGTNRQCKRESPEYLKIISDLHNIVPANSKLSFKIKESFFGQLDNSIPKDEFGFRKMQHIVEPEDDVKGDIARAIFYMRDTYQLPILGFIDDLKRWNMGDPPSTEELQRNNAIEKIQGTRNPYIVETVPKIMDKPTAQNTNLNK